jgi:hypothetical protein
MTVSPAGPKTYIITFGVSGVNINSLHQYLFDSADVVAFWNYIPLVYCIKSHLSSTELASKLKPFFAQDPYLIAEVNVQNLNGVLPKEAWDWFYLNHHEKGRPPVPISGFGGLARLGYDPLAPRGLAGLLTPFLKEPE